MSSSDTPKELVRVTIFNQTYNVSTSDDRGKVEELAQEIDELMSSIARRTGNLDPTRAAVLACLHLADRLRTAERELSVLKERVDHKSRDFAILLDRAFDEEDAEYHPHRR
jgi:cell division protein ZapA